MTKVNSAAVSAVLIIMIMLSATLGLVVAGETQMKGLISAAASDNSDGSSLGQPSYLIFAVMPEKAVSADKKADGEKTDRLFYVLKAPSVLSLNGKKILKSEKKSYNKPVLTENIVLLE